MNLRLNAATGVEAFDRSSWSLLAPTHSCVYDGGGFTTLMQHLPHVQNIRGECDVFANNNRHQIVILLNGCRHLEARVGERRHDSDFAPGTAIMLPAGVDSW
jgi:hypothetical protein